MAKMLLMSAERTIQSILLKSPIVGRLSYNPCAIRFFISQSIRNMIDFDGNNEETRKDHAHTSDTIEYFVRSSRI